MNKNVLFYVGSIQANVGHSITSQWTTQALPETVRSSWRDIIITHTFTIIVYAIYIPEI